MTPKQLHKQTYADYKYLYDNFGEPNDFCGAFCNTEQYVELLEMPTYSKATEHLINLIEFYFQYGLDSGSGHSNDEVDVLDARVYEIKQRYDI